MARDLSDTIFTLFNGHYSYHYSYHYTDVAYNKAVRFMEIPITDDTFEMPILALSEFEKLIMQKQDMSTDALVVRLFSRGRTSSYKSLDRVMRDNLLESFGDNRLVVTPVGSGQDAHTYYSTYGAIFDSDFTPVFMCSYIMQRIPPAEGEDLCTYEFVRPVLTVAPHVFINKLDAMQRLISNKIMVYSLNNSVSSPSFYNSGGRVRGINRSMSVKVQLDASPFKLHDTPSPSISTTNEQLLQTVIDRIDNEFTI